MNSTYLQQLAQERRQRYADRDARMKRMRDVLRGQFDVSFRDIVPPGEEPVVANIPLAATRTIAQRVGQMPRLHAASRTDSASAKERAERHERAIYERLDAMNFSGLLRQGCFWLVPHGLLPFTLTFDRGLGHARVRIRDPLQTYPATVWPHEPGVDDCLFLMRMPRSQVLLTFPESERYFGRKDSDEITDVTVAEYHHPDATYLSIIDPEPFDLAAIPNPTGRVNVWVARDFTPDLDFHGQFDQVVPIMLAHARLMALVQSYAEQLVFAPTVVTGRIDSNDGDWAEGPGAVNQLTPEPGAGATKLVANMSPQVFQELAGYERQERIAGSIPAALTGEAGSSVATGKGIQALLENPVDENIAHYQDMLAVAIKDILGRIPEFERAHGLIEPRFSRDVTVYPQFAVGTDPGTTVRLLQLVGSKVVSRRTVMDQLPEFDDPGAEEARIETEALREALVASLLQQAQQGAVDLGLLSELIRKREKGTPIEEALAEYVEAQQQAAAEAGAPEAPVGMAPEAGGGPPSLEAILGLTSAGAPIAGVTGRTPI